MYLFVGAAVEKWQVCFFVSQGSVATYVRCGGKHDNGFIANSLLDATVIEFRKLVNVSHSYARM